MYLRFSSAVAALVLAVTPALAEPPKPTIVAQAKPVARLMGDFREMVRQPPVQTSPTRCLKDFDNGLKELLGEQGFEGLDINRPMVLTLLSATTSRTPRPSSWSPSPARKSSSACLAV